MNNPFESLTQQLIRIENKLGELDTSFHRSKTTSNNSLDPEPLIYGIKGLAKFLQVSTVTAQKIKNSGKIPFSQVERTIVLNKVDVLEALKKKAGKRHG